MNRVRGLGAPSAGWDTNDGGTTARRTSNNIDEFEKDEIIYFHLVVDEGRVTINQDLSQGVLFAHPVSGVHCQIVEQPNHLADSIGMNSVLRFFDTQGSSRF